MDRAIRSYYGMANKNVGDAFLLSWKLCDGTLEGYANFEDTPDDETRERANETVRYTRLNIKPDPPVLEGLAEIELL